jgi:hypothetical protein
LWEKYTAVSGGEAFAEAEDLLGLERFAPRKYASTVRLQRQKNYVKLPQTSSYIILRKRRIYIFHHFSILARSFFFHDKQLS